MKKYILGVITSFLLVGSVGYAVVPRLSSITTATGISIAPIAPPVVQDIVLPPTTFSLGSYPAGESRSAYFSVINNGNISEVVSVSIVSYSPNMTIAYYEFSENGQSSITIPAGGSARLDVRYTTSVIPVGSSNEDIEFQVKFDVL